MKKEKTIVNIEDLIQNESFRNWILNNEYNTYWEDFAIDSAKNAHLVERAKTFFLTFNAFEEKFSDFEVEEQLYSLKSKLDVDFHKKRRSSFRLVLATLAIVLISGSFFFNKFYPADNTSNYNTSPAEGLIEQINNSNAPKLITLSDGSSVLLQPKSKLSYSNEFDIVKREVFLEGEAFFEVSKNQYKPFFVYSNEVVTHVYGTSFRVIAFDELDEVKVIVKTGKVKLRKSNIIDKYDLNEITLLPNQAARFDRNEKLFDKVIQIEEDKQMESDLTKIDKLNFVFVDTPITQIFSTIEDLYHLRIEFTQDNLENCFVTTSLSDVPLPEKLKILCFSIGDNTTYELVGNKIIINSDGCK